MQFSENQNTWRWTIIVVSFVIVVLILLNTYSFFQIFKNEERIKMEQWAEAQKTLQNALIGSPSPETLWLGIRIARALGDKDAEASYALQLRQQHPNAEQTRLLLSGQK